MSSKPQNRVYYGEYSLDHWIKLILTKNIELPDYQRHFVWDLPKAQELIQALKENQFVPPVTIGSFTDGGGKQENLILDGQQRLTSVLLSYLGIFPNRSGFSKKRDAAYVQENDDPDDDEDNDEIMTWTFKDLLRQGSTEEEILGKIDPKHYVKQDYDLNPSFFRNSYLGFSYIVPAYDSAQQQQNFYSKVFRSINIQGTSLEPLESRYALYYLDKELTDFFSPDFARKIRRDDQILDFVRFLALLSQYLENSESVEGLAAGYARRMEAYYEEYIYASIGDGKSSIFKPLRKIANDLSVLSDRLDNLKVRLDEFGLLRPYESIIDIDIYLFGLVFQILFKGKDVTKKAFAQNSGNFKEKIQQFKGERLHSRNPSALKYLRRRLAASLVLYESVVNAS